MTETTLLWGPPQIIDPDDRDQMERFARLHDEAWRRVVDRNPSRVGTPTWEVVAEQFRPFKDPTYRAKPDEPKGLGAVVEDQAGCLWVRFTSKSGPWWRNHVGENRRWETVAAAKVLNEGVPD